ncbi:hypothetical protein BJX99DRAFT_272460 [Aspergillus californicus]
MRLSHPSSTSTNPTIHITFLTISTLLILTVLILIIGPSRILSDSYSSPSACQSQGIHVTTDSSITPPLSNILQTAQYDGRHIRKYNSSSKLLATTIDPKDPYTWEGLLSPPLAAGGLRVQADSINHLDDYPDVPADDVPGGVGQVIAMMHQLHCLIGLRGLTFPENNNVAVNSSSKSYQEETIEKNRGHWSHCFDYLAQAIICHADDTIERPKKVLKDGGKSAYWKVDGGGAIHQCRDPRPIWEMSIRSHLDPIDMSKWREGIGAREFFADELKETGYRHEIPDIFSLGVLGGGVL